VAMSAGGGAIIAQRLGGSTRGKRRVACKYRKTLAVPPYLWNAVGQRRSCTTNEGCFILCNFLRHKLQRTLHFRNCCSRIKISHNIFEPHFSEMCLRCKINLGFFHRGRKYFVHLHEKRSVKLLPRTQSDNTQ